mgnify:CR=1 FL=1
MKQYRHNSPKRLNFSLKQEKELNVLHIQLAEQSKESELIKERAVIEKEREMLSKIEELRNALDEAKEEKYNLRLQLTKLPKIMSSG